MTLSENATLSHSRDRSFGAESPAQTSATAEPRVGVTRCLPQGICSWNFRLNGGICEGMTELNTLADGGRILVLGEWFDVKKESWLPERWSLTFQDQKVASAERTSPIHRHFRIETPCGTMELDGESPLSRNFILQFDEQKIARFVPDHSFTRRSQIETLRDDLDAPILVFGFWLAVVMWR